MKARENLMRHQFIDHHSGIESPIHHLDARAKIIVLFTFIVIGVSIPPRHFAVFGVLALGLMSLTVASRLPVLHLLRKLLVVLPFLLVITASIPFMKKEGAVYPLQWDGVSVSKVGLSIFWNVMIKSCLGVFSIILLYSTTTFPQLIKGLEGLGTPKVITILLSFMYRYSFILVDELHRMKRARDSRDFGGRWFWQVKTIGHTVGTLFLRSFHRGERIYLAMLSRGYQGTMPGVSFRGFGLKEYFFLFIIPLLVFLRFFLI